MFTEDKGNNHIRHWQRLLRVMKTRENSAKLASLNYLNHFELYYAE